MVRLATILILAATLGAAELTDTQRLQIREAQLKLVSVDAQIAALKDSKPALERALKDAVEAAQKAAGCQITQNEAGALECAPKPKDKP